MKKIIRKTLLGIIIIFVVISSCDMFMSETQSNKKEFTSFNVQGWEADGVAQIISPTITATLPSDADLTQLVIYFTTSPGSSVTVYGRPQVSGRTVNDFTRTVEYMITAENGTTFTYYVDITKEKQEQSDFSLGNNIEKGVNAANFTQIATGVNGTGTTTYSSSDISIATVNSSTGEVNIIAVGETTITATNPGDESYNSATASYTITVNNKQDQEALTFSDIIDNLVTKNISDNSFTYIATGGSGTGAITYLSTNTSFATVSTTDGQVTIIGAGTTTITATKAGDDTYNAISESYTLTIGDSTSKEEQSAFTIGDNLEKNISAANFIQVATGSGGTSSTTYSSSNTSVATVNSSTGEVNIIAVGETTITATNPGDESYNSATASYTITVSKADQTSFSIGSDRTEPDFITSFTQEATGGSGSGTITYTSTNNNVATVNTSGYVTIVGTGATTITATKAGDDNYNSITDSYILTVERPFITTWDFVGAAGSYSVTIPTRSNWAYDCYIDWGDNSVEHYTRNSGLSTNPSHEYTIGNEKIIKIYGTFPAIYFGSAGSTDIKSIDQWGDVVWEDFYSAFSGCTNLQMKATDIPIITNNINTYSQRMSKMFKECTNTDFSTNGNWEWDVSNITAMDEMFRSATSFNGNISSWNVSNVTDMHSMFDSANVFNQNISSWNVSNVTNMSYMFYNVNTFNYNLNPWKPANSCTHLDFGLVSTNEPTWNSH